MTYGETVIEHVFIFQHSSSFPYCWDTQVGADA